MKFLAFVAALLALPIGAAAGAEVTTTVDGVTIPFTSVARRDQYLAMLRAGKNVFITPKPPFPYAVKRQRLYGQGVVRATFTRPGRPTSVQMIRSTGSSLLDENTRTYAAANWLLPRHSRGFPQTKDVPIVYVSSR